MHEVAEIKDMPGKLRKYEYFVGGLDFSFRSVDKLLAQHSWDSILLVIPGGVSDMSMNVEAERVRDLFYQRRTWNSERVVLAILQPHYPIPHTKTTGKELSVHRL